MFQPLWAHMNGELAQSLTLGSKKVWTDTLVGNCGMGGKGGKGQRGKEHSSLEIKRRDSH